MELYPVQPVLGYSEILWSLCQTVRRWRSGKWATVQGTVEGYELLQAGPNGGWAAVFYSYEFGRERYSGEMRRYVVLCYRGDEEPIQDVIDAFPRGAHIEVCVNPKHPDQSVVP